ncbi:Na+/H+ antiporter NhaA [uncultured Sphingomonas sp.]|uniref:Na+/H+ antiporter NhaA n=1 Tax=uncultured Sphingomonas sp. TaxID=158754 RepID=UPI0035CB998F
MTQAKLRRERPSALRAFLSGEALGGSVLIIAAVLALIAANSPAAVAYFKLLHLKTGPTLSPGIGPMTVHLWVNDGLMAVFFLLVGLESKREFVDGELATWKRRRLPVIAAVAGMAAPALVYLAVAGGDPTLHRGWAIPAATDIAFAIGVLALLGSRVPSSLKLLLTSVAIVDDMGAVAIIALAYTDTIHLPSLLAAVGVMLVLYTCNRRGITALPVYLIGFAILWLLVLMSGVHATIAGVLAAMVVPVRRSPGAPDDAGSPLHRLEHALHPWVAYAIVPLFGFVNAGVSFAGSGIATLTEPLVLAIALGLFVGKQLGIFGAVWLACRTGIARMPAGVTWRQLYGMALIAGIGFTMSLFIGGLAFPGRPELVDAVKIGVLLGSTLSAVAGAILLAKKPVRR